MKSWEIGLRWIVFLGVLGLTLLPGWLGLTVMPRFAEYSRFFSAAWSWLILATLPGGIARVEFDGAIYGADTGWLIALGFWVIIGGLSAYALRTMRLAYFTPLAVVVVFACGLLVHLALGAFGYAANVMP